MNFYDHHYRSHGRYYHAPGVSKANKLQYQTREAIQLKLVTSRAAAVANKEHAKSNLDILLQGNHNNGREFHVYRQARAEVKIILFVFYSFVFPALLN